MRNSTKLGFSKLSFEDMLIEIKTKAFLIGLEAGTKQTRQKVREAIDDFEDNLISCLGWDKITIDVNEERLLKENRCKIARKFDILRDEIGLDDEKVRK
jgi:hypothetical protein